MTGVGDESVGLVFHLFSVGEIIIPDQIIYVKLGESAIVT